ncbi:hypothetical protein ACFY30_31635 [Streptomyces sp. NPDC000345]|uniref:hypothetical protein n=1 Tax=Streptomyces sp. NPDC000345 TaxID=3364537 RepID=UPI00367A25B7
MGAARPFHASPAASEPSAPNRVPTPWTVAMTPSVQKPSQTWPAWWVSQSQPSYSRSAGAPHGVSGA